MKKAMIFLMVTSLICLSGWSMPREQRGSVDETPIDFDNLTSDLTEEEKKDPAAQYFHDPSAKIDDDFEKQVLTELAEEQMFYPNDISLLMNPDFGFQNGYGVLENGVTYSAVETVFQGVTKEIYDQYNQWSNFYDNQTLIYKIWYPGYHYAQARSGNGLEIVEDIGQGMEDIRMLSNVGSRERVADNRIIETYQVNSSNTVLATGAEIPGILLHVKYINEAGFVVDRCVAWFGCNLSDGKLIVDTDYITDGLERARGMALHSAGENTNLTAVMLEFDKSS